MPPVTKAQFRGWLKSAVNMKLSSYASVLCITYEGLKKFDSFTDFDRESIESLGKSYSKTIDDIIADPPNGIQAENEVPRTNISTIYIRRLVVATHAVNYYRSIGRVPGYYNMNYVNVLSAFNADHDAYSLIWKQDSPDTPFVSDQDKEKKIIKWVPLFEDSLSCTFGSKGTLVYVISESAIVPDVSDDPLDADSHYGAASS